MLFHLAYHAICVWWSCESVMLDLSDSQPDVILRRLAGLADPSWLCDAIWDTSYILSPSGSNCTVRRSHLKLNNKYKIFWSSWEPSLGASLLYKWKWGVSSYSPVLMYGQTKQLVLTVNWFSQKETWMFAAKEKSRQLRIYGRRQQ